MDLIEIVIGEGENAAAQAKKKKSEPRVMVPFTSEELDEVIRQGFTVIEKESQKEEYDNGRLEVWKGMLEDYIVKAASLSDKPFKYTFYVSVQQNTGDAAYMAMGALFQADFDGHTSAHWENDDILVDVTVMAFSVQWTPMAPELSFWFLKIIFYFLPVRREPILLLLLDQ